MDFSCGPENAECTSEENEEKEGIEQTPVKKARLIKRDVRRQRTHFAGEQSDCFSCRRSKNDRVEAGEEEDHAGPAREVEEKQEIESQGQEDAKCGAVRGEVPEVDGQGPKDASRKTPDRSVFYLVAEKLLSECKLTPKKVRKKGGIREN